MSVPAWIVGVAVWAIGAAIFFRDPFRSGFDTITGDRGDARLVVYLHEHWWRVLNGDATWRSPDFFFPSRDTLGYSDTFALDLVVYAPLRLLGIEQFMAFQLTLVALTAVGFASLFVLFRRYCGVGIAASSLLAATGTFANNVFVDTGHPQLFAMNVTSLIMLLFVAAFHAATVRRQLLGAAVGGLLVGVLTWSTFYFGWFTIFLGSMACVLLAVATVATQGMDALITAMRRRWTMAVAAAAGLLVGLVPFFLTYLPVLGDSERRTYDEVANLAPRPLDLVNVGRGNVMWGGLIERLMGGDERLDMLNRAVAPTPVLLLALAVAIVDLVRHVRRASASRTVIIGLVAGVVAVIAWLLPIQFSFGGAWAWAHRFVPGGSALRVFARIEVLAALAACVAIACWLGVRSSDAEPSDYGRLRKVGPIVLLALIAFEQINTTSGFRRFDRSDELAVLVAVPDPPATCDVFFVTDADQAETDHTAITAMLISHRIDLPTINGYSGQAPPGWDLQPWADGYPGRVAQWLDSQAPGLTPCSIEITTLEWSPTDSPNLADG